MARWLVTGAAGFIGSFVCKALADRGEEVVGVDNLDPYYDPHLKLLRLARVASPHFRYVPIDISDPVPLASIFSEVQPEKVIHLTAPTRVRHAVTHPVPYSRTNLMGFVHVLEVGSGFAVLVSPLQPVLFTALSRLQHDPPRLRRSFRRTVHLVGALAFPVGRPRTALAVLLDAPNSREAALLTVGSSRQLVDVAHSGVRLR